MYTGCCLHEWHGKARNLRFRGSFPPRVDNHFGIHLLKSGLNFRHQDNSATNKLEANQAVTTDKDAMKQEISIKMIVIKVLPSVHRINKCKSHKREILSQFLLHFLNFTGAQRQRRHCVGRKLLRKTDNRA